MPSTIEKIWILVPFTASAAVKNAGGRLELSHTFKSRTLDNDNNAKNQPRGRIQFSFDLKT